MDNFYPYIYVYIYIYVVLRTYRTQMTHILEDLTHKMEGEPPKKEVIRVLGTVYICRLISSRKQVK